MTDSVMRDITLDSNIIDVDIYARGRGVVETTTQYALGDSATTQPTSWSNDFPTLIQGKFLWIKNTSTYSDNTTYDAYFYTYLSKDGGYYTPSVSDAGLLHWTPSITELPDVTDVNIANITANLIDFNADDTDPDTGGKLVRYSTDGGTTWSDPITTLPTSGDPDIMKVSAYVGNDASGSVHNADYVNGFTLGQNVPSDAALTDTLYNVAQNSGLSLTNNNFSLTNTGVTAGAYNASATGTAATIQNNSIKVPYFTVDAQGRLTAASLNTYSNLDTYTVNNKALSTNGNYPLLFSDTVVSSLPSEASNPAQVSTKSTSEIYVNPSTNSIYGQHFYKQWYDNNTLVSKELGYGNILYGTTAPTSNAGNVGDIYLQYTE